MNSSLNVHDSLASANMLLDWYLADFHYSCESSDSRIGLMSHLEDGRKAVIDGHSSLVVLGYED